jgi:hypothetical protein
MWVGTTHLREESFVCPFPEGKPGRHAIIIFMDFLRQFAAPYLSVSVLHNLSNDLAQASNSSRPPFDHIFVVYYIKNS